MRVLVVTSHKILEEEAGTPKHINKLVVGLSSRSIEVCVIQLEIRTRFFYKTCRQERKGVQVNIIPLMGWITESRKLIKEFQPDAFLIFTSGAACRFLPLLWLYGTPLIYEVHTVFSSFSLHLWLSSIYSQLERLVCRRAQHIIVLGEKVKDIYCRERNCDSRRISIIYPGVKIDNFKDIALSSKDQSDSINVTYLGNLIYENHGIGYLLQAAKIVISRNRNINFFLVGKPDDAEKKYKDLYVDNDRIKFIYTDNISEIDAILADSDILIHTRIYSRHNLSVQSKFAVYMACGKPVVITDFADYKMFAEGYKCGYAVKLKSEEIASAILHLADNSELRFTMGCNSLELAKTHFDINKNIDRYVEILESVIS